MSTKLTKVLSLLLAVLTLMCIVSTNNTAYAATTDMNYSDTSLAAMRKRADAIVNYKWTPIKNINTWNGNTYNGKTYFPANVVVTGVPYTLFAYEATSHQVALGEFDHLVNSNKTYTAYCTSVGANRTGPYYGSCCASFVSEVFGGSYVRTKSNGYVEAKHLNTRSVRDAAASTVIYNAKATDIKPGDALISSDYAHIIWVYDKTSTQINIYEQTPPVAIKSGMVSLTNHTTSNGVFKWGSKEYTIIVRSSELSTSVDYVPGFYTTKNVNENSYLSLRKGPSTSYTMILKIPAKAIFEVIATCGNGWVQVNYKTKTGTTANGYVSSEYIKVVENPFTDIYSSKYYFNAVLWAKENGITSGTSATTFSPSSDLSRAQFVTLLWRANGAPNPKTTNNPFTDVKKSDYYYKAVLWAVENGITAGTSSTTFSPNSNVTRSQLVTFMYRAAGANYTPGSTVQSRYTDISTTSYYYIPLLWMEKNGYLNNITGETGLTSTKFGPNTSSSRALAITLMYRILCQSKY